MLMARLNDPPVPPAESLDALKRRFIRQNREIARVNSTQSQRIRNLETEISRLLAENIALREQAIGAAVEAERWRAASRIGKDVLNLQLRLKAKLGEVDLLVEELGGLPDKAARRSSVRRRKSGYVQELTVSSNDEDWRNRQILGGVSSGERDGQDGRLPAIMEDKYYPRRTLETEELRILTAASNLNDDGDSESPDLGPPPVAHFEVADPILFDSASSPKRVSGGIVPNDDEVVSLPKNLEARRKRRTSFLLQDLSALHDQAEEPSESNDIQTAPPAKSNAKRKFETSGMEIETNAVSQNDGFEYSRRQSTGAKPSRFTSNPANRPQEQKVVSQPASPQRATESRKVLAPKSTNSPTKKATLQPMQKNNLPQSDHQSPVKTNTRRTIRMSRIEAPMNDEIAHDTYAPKTPAPPLDDIISPPSSAMDTAPKHKSIEAAITNSVEDVLNGSIGRGSRRAKSAVSYAEPNLRDKMRRPDKKLVGAVEGINKLNNTSDKESGRESTRERSNDPIQASTVKAVNSKTEVNLSTEDNQWKNLSEARLNEEAASPLKDKERSNTTKPIETRKKRTFSESEGTRSKQPPNPGENLDKAVARLSIYDPPKSSPVKSPTSENEPMKPSRQSSTSTTTSKDLVTTRKPPPDRPSSAASTTRARRHSVQPSQDSILSIQSKRSSSALPTRDISGKENINHTATSKLKRASSVQTISQSGLVSAKSEVSGVEQALGRRRSTML